MGKYLKNLVLLVKLLSFEDPGLSLSGFIRLNQVILKQVYNINFYTNFRMIKNMLIFRAYLANLLFTYNFFTY